MKKDRNCGPTPYPIYQDAGMMPIGGMQGMPMQGLQGMNMPMPMPSPTPIMQGTMSQSNINTTELNTLTQQVNSLEKRVANLENMVNKSCSNNYNTSNYQMM